MTDSQETMHPSIKTLSAQLANQIAAGEVVERPASVVKELVENSLDAGATQVHVEIDQGGQKRILIRDNGRGIVKDELSLALSRHATSKISNIDDLENIRSMGFRGEALASISSVSRLTLTSKPALQAEAWQATTEGQQMAVDIKPAAHPDGTSIEVLDLFFNTPARRKFLRSGKTEFQHIEQILKRLALTRPEVQFTLVHNHKVVFKYTSTSLLSARIEQVCGKAMLSKAVPVDYQFEGIALHGWCSELGYGVSTRDYQYTFVNGRMMRDKLLAHALRQVFEETLPPQTFPTYVVFLTLPPDQLDVNVHPAKHEVRFHEARKIHDLVFKGVSDALSQASNTNLAPETANHDYILPLQSTDSLRVNMPVEMQEQSFPEYSTRDNVSTRPQNTNKSGYFSAALSSKTPSKQALNANHGFYQSIYEQKEQTEAHIQRPVKCLLVYPNAILVRNGDAIALAVQYILATDLQQKLTRCTKAQALLMPVSVSPSLGLAQGDILHIITALSAHHFVVEQKQGRIVLTQVPSEWRALPWASLFEGLLDAVLNKLADVNQANVFLMSNLVAKIYFPLLPEVDDDLMHRWLQNIGEEAINTLCQQRGVNIDLAGIMTAYKAKDDL